jgi:hypothetical protein
MQVRLKKTSGDLATFALRMVSGGFLGLTLSLVVQEALGKKEGDDLISFFFVIVATCGAFLRVSKKWTLASVLIFDLICVLVGMILRLYIMVAPGA